jgi:hypothetical protein
MADLLGGGNPAVTNGNGATSSRPTAPPTQAGSPSRGIRGPRMIMQERQEREARQRAEREQMERSRAEQEARLLEEQTRLERERRAAAGAAAGTGANLPPQAVEATTRRQQRAEAQARQAAAASQAQPTTQSNPQRQPRAPASQPGGYPTIPATSGPAPTTAGGATAGQTGEGSTRPRNSFPHAFERWEALSAHWEGLTSFWIRQLQQRSDEIDRDPLSQQLSRQVNDLSAAGANLFHAVVELQRLRASSERKFQRWFFETRGDLERLNEVNAMLEGALDEERRGRADAIRDAVEHERVHSRTQKHLLEMRKELSISKEEARRAWEELGRREQEERDRTISLQQGLPTIVGGVQVVPMTQGVPSRHGSTRTSGPPEQSPAEYTRPQGGRTAGSGQQEAPGGYYQPPGTTGAHEGGGGYAAVAAGSEGGYSEGEYAIDGNGNFIRDAHGNKVPFRGAAASPGSESDAGAEEYADPPAAPQPPPQQQPTNYPPSSSHHYYPQGQPDYAGQGYAAPGWETVPRHHHPTRLSDVIEEDDERSRTSASQVSRGQ